jgi:hypothetical protein
MSTDQNFRSGNLLVPNEAVDFSFFCSPALRKSTTKGGYLEENENEKLVFYLFIIILLSGK